ncbi:ECF transporter S component [Bacillota bacterium LX-D]|nr:ECF transporter S component [Bacillota bacterium LX-D]
MKFSIKEMTYIAILSALTVMAIYFARMPAFGGKLVFHFGETVILTSALLLGSRGGFWVGALGSSIADLLLGYSVWAPASFVIHGMEGYLVGKASENNKVKDIFALIFGVSFMVFGYAVTAGFLYGKAAIPIELFGDLIQGGIGVVTAFLLTTLLRKSVPSIATLRDEIRGSNNEDR